MLEALLATPAASGGPIAGDTVLLMHFNGSFADAAGNQVTASGEPITQGITVKYGSGAASFPGAGRLTVPDATGLRLNADWTIEGWMRVASADYNQNTSMMGKGPLAWIQYFGGYIYLHDDAGSYRADANIGAADTWHHFAFTQGGGVQEVFIDGTKRKTVTANAQFGNNTSSLIIGSSDGYNAPFKGLLDELRISRNRIYTANFTPLGPFTL